MNDPMLMRSCSGATFDPWGLTVDDLDVVTIAGALSKLCRFGGHCTPFYSVARHSVLVAEALLEETHSLELAKWGLMHDAIEAFLGDVPTPIKRKLPLIEQAERRAQQMLAERYALPWPIPREVHDADAALLAAEMTALMPNASGGPPRRPFVGRGPYARYVAIKPERPELDRADFLDLHGRLFS